MELIKFNDKCTITRVMLDVEGNAIYNEYDEPMVEDVYYGDCSYQVGGVSNRSIMVRNDVVYLPTNDVIVVSGDMIEIETARGRNRKGVVSDARDIELPLTHECYTKVELKQGMGD